MEGGKGLPERMEKMMKNAILISATALTLALAVTHPSLATGGAGGAFLDPDRFDLIDTDKNGTLSEAELAADRALRFAKADTNGDGKLSAVEMAAFHKPGDGERAAKRMGRMIAHLDKDDDGALTLAEMSASKRAQKIFGRIDSDDDGALSKPEIAAARGRMKEHGKGHGHGTADE